MKNSIITIAFLMSILTFASCDKETANTNLTYAVITDDFGMQVEQHAQGEVKTAKAETRYDGTYWTSQKSNLWLKAESKGNMQAYILKNVKKNGKEKTDTVAKASGTGELIISFQE